MPDKVAVFIDYENVHRTGHGLFARPGEQLYQMVVNPLLLSELIVAERKLSGVLSEVSVFRGRPVPAFQPKPASANDIQAAVWESDPRVTVARRDLKYDRYEDGTFLARENCHPAPTQSTPSRSPDEPPASSRSWFGPRQDLAR